MSTSFRLIAASLLSLTPVAIGAESAIPSELDQLAHAYYAAVEAEDFEQLRPLLQPAAGMSMEELEQGYTTTFDAVDVKIHGVEATRFETDDDGSMGGLWVTVPSTVSMPDGSDSFDQELTYVMIIARTGDGWKVAKVMQSSIFELQGLSQRTLELPDDLPEGISIEDIGPDLKAEEAEVAVAATPAATVAATPRAIPKGWKQIEHAKYSHTFAIPGDWVANQGEVRGETIQVFQPRMAPVPQVRVVHFPVPKPMTQEELKGTVQQSLAQGGVFRKSLSTEAIKLDCGLGQKTWYEGDLFGFPLQTLQIAGTKGNDLIFLAVMMTPGDSAQKKIATQIGDSFTLCE
ncbi:hypothetical protein KQI84_01530 [bacterium]|nr:hypothetical protein [bacterium]